MPYRPGEREAGWQLPSSLDALIPATHAVRFVAAYVDSLDLTDWQHLGVSLEPKERGASRYHPKILLSLWVWGFMQGVRSSRKLEAACVEQLSYRWLTGQQSPDHNTLWRFYQEYRAGMRYLLTHSVQLAVKAGLIDLALQAVDGTKIAGNAAKDRTYDGAGLDRLIERLEQAIADLEAQNATAGEDAPPRLPEELATKEALLRRVRQAKEALEGRRWINLTDADAQLMKARGGYVAGYNAQAMVSALDEAVAGTTGMLITAADVTCDREDSAHLVPMLERAAASTGVLVPDTVADGGYQSADTLARVEERKQRITMPTKDRNTTSPYFLDRFDYDPASDHYRCPAGQILTYRGTKQSGTRLYRASGAVCRACPAFGVCTTDRRQGRSLGISPLAVVRHTHRVWMATTEAKARYQRRQELVEPVFGVLKEQQAARRFLLRGLEAVQAEWGLLATAFNLRTLARIWQQEAPCGVGGG
jgi:transposase